MSRPVSGFSSTYASLLPPEDHEDGRLTEAKNLGSDRIRWSVTIGEASDLSGFMDLVDAAYDAN